MVIRELIADLTGQLNDNALYEAQELVMSVLGISNTELVLNRNREVSENDKTAVYEKLLRRKKGEPLQYITGTAGFMGLEFKVTPDVLIPRADTETLAEEIISIADGCAKLLDIGTGSGCIGISVAHFKPDTEVTFLDISKKALEIAKYNAKKNNVNGIFVNMDILKEYPKERFDIIVSNPPYICDYVIKDLQTEVKDYEPYGALSGGADGLLFYRRITEIAPEMLNENGILAYEIGCDQGEAVSELMRKSFCNVRVLKDLCGNDRVIIGEMKMRRS